MKATMVVVVLCLSMAQTLQSLNQFLSVPNGTLISLMDQDCDTRLRFASRQVSHCGSMALSLVVAGVT